MNIITIDMETYYDPTYSLSKISTEEYVRSDQFQVIGFSYKLNDNHTVWISGTDEHIKEAINKLAWDASFVLCHNTMFDGAILSWRYGVKPRGWLDTLSMGRALHGINAGGSLKAMAERYGVGVKGTEVINALGKRRSDFTYEELNRYGQYCNNDVDLTWSIFNKMMAAGFPKIELRLIDLTLSMFIHPVLELDLNILEKHLADTVRLKQEHLANALKAIGNESLAVRMVLGDAGALDEVKKTLMSNPKFAEILLELGVTPPKKISPTTGKETLAFSKTDEGFKTLLEHDDVRVQAICSARIGTKSTLEETRTQRFINIAKRGKFPIPLKYYAAHTGRWGGTDSVNLQNLPSRGQNANKLKKAIIAPEGYVFIDADSSQIEARCLAWEAEQEDLVNIFVNNNAEIAAGVDKKNFVYDPYKIMASAIYNKPTTAITDPERFVGKTTILGCGYGMGGAKFQAQLKTFGTDIDLEEAKRIVSAYRMTYPRIPELWKETQIALSCMVRGMTMKLGRNGLLTVDKEGILLPNGLHIYYNNIREVMDNNTGHKRFVYDTRSGPNDIYGGKCVENYTQAIARCVIGEQMLRIAKKYKVVLTVHDAIGIIAREEEKDEAVAFVEECMRWVPSWAEGLPVNCESGMGRSYGDC